MGITPLLNFIRALHQIAYGIPEYISDDLFEVSQTTDYLSLEELCTAVTAAYLVTYLHEPTADEIVCIVPGFCQAGFLICIVCFFFCGWKWKNFPESLKEIMTGKEGVGTARMEVIWAIDAWIWSFQFGLSWYMNDLNI